jgi:hypothetical protein
MIAEIQSGAPEIPQYALWTFGGWILSCLISGWSGYRWGLCAQKEAEKLKARIEVLTLIDRIFADIPNDFEFWRLRGRTRDALNATTFKFSCQLSESSRLKIQTALDDYHQLDISYSFSPIDSNPDRARIEKEHKMFMEGLNKLRYEIKNA